MKQVFDLNRFIDAQSNMYEQALLELKQGKKKSHWMWFIFPQISGLGHSPTASYYSIANIDEARAYLQHEALGPRLIECTQAVLRHHSLSANHIFGFPDELKFCSCMTLFIQAAVDTTLFERAIKQFYSGNFDDRTLAILASVKA